jgi:hypothetical protein
MHADGTFIGRRGWLPGVGGGVVANFLTEVIKHAGVVGSYIYSFVFLGIPSRYYLYGALISFALCVAFFSPILSDWAFRSTVGFDHTAQNRYMSRYWTWTLIVFVTLTATGAFLSYYFETRIVFQ